MDTLKALGAHIYAGGFTLGVREHFDVLGHFEDGPFGVETVRQNLGLDVHQKPWPVEDYRGEEIDLIYCNPPCAPWSTANSRNTKKWAEDPRLNCQHDCFNLLTELRPKIWMLESVRGLYNKGLPLVMDFVGQAREMGYCAYFVLVDAKEHATPQVRRRFFLVLSEVEITWHQSYSPEVLPRDVLEGFEDPDTDKTELRGTVRWHNILDRVDPGEYIRTAFDREFPELKGVPKCGRGSFLLKRLHPDRPAQTFTGDCKTIHHEEDRHITVGEAAALSGFPPWYRFHGVPGKRYNQIARGVLPNVAEYMADMAQRAIRRGWHPQTLDPREVKVFSDKVECKHV